MASLTRFLIPVLLCALALVAARGAHGAEPQEPWTPPGFSLNDDTGVPFTFPEDLQRPTIVLFWATWCPYCKALMPHLQSILDEYGEQVDVIALHIWDEDDARAYLDNYGFQFRLLPDADAVAEAWGVKGTPGLFLVDRTGTVVFSRGAIPREAFRLTEAEQKELKNVQKAARVAPLWAARLRMALDQITGSE